MKQLIMSSTKSYLAVNKKGPSMLALLVDDISRMSPSEQKSLWLQINKQKLSSYAQLIDASTPVTALTPSEIDALITEAKSYARKKKKG